MELQKKHNVRIRLDAKDHTFCIFAGIDENGGYIRIGLAVLERLWAYCYGFTVIVEIVKQTVPGKIIELKDKPEAALAWKFLKWAYAGEKERVRYKWEEDFPMPGSTSDDPFVENTDKFFAMVIGFFILHEMGHIILGHLKEPIDPAKAISEELAADAFAARLMLERCPRDKEPDTLFIARANAIATGLTLLSGVEVEARNGVIRDHPKVPERLLHFFNNHIPESDGDTAPIQEYPMYFSSILLEAFALNAGLDFPYCEKHPDFMTFFVRACQAFP